MSADTDFQAQLLGIDSVVKTSHGSRIRIWFIPILVVAILAVVLVMYHFGYTSKEWVNRIGIIFNFLAGFMLAPELLGIARIKHAETFVRAVSLRVNTYITGVKTNTLAMYNAIKGIWFGGGFFQAFYLILLTFLFLFTILLYSIGEHDIGRLVLLLMLVIIGELYIRATITRVRKREFNPRITLIDMSVFTAASPVGIVTAVFMILIWCIYLPIYHMISRLSNYIIRKLETDNGLRTILVWWGIVLFIIGNALQFYSTFP